MRTYKVVEPRPGLPNLERTYKGFNQNFSAASEVNHVVLVLVEGEVETWVIDNPQKVSSFVQYLSDNDYPEATQILGVYSRK
jgi:hypothetical protein